MNSAVLFLVFNRPETTEEVFKAIKKAKPPRLYVAADGPRGDRLGELEKTAKVRQIVAGVDWPCEVKTLFRDQNLGCKKAVSSALDWYFEHEEMGIILEDDTVPNQVFFEFCSYCLDRFKDDERVMMITGTNYLSNENGQFPFFMSEHMTIWGWATWRRSWGLYDVEMKKWDDDNVKSDLKYKFGGGYIWDHFEKTFDALKKNYADTWDIQWFFTCVSNGGLCVTPKVNLVQNIGVVGAHSDIVTDSHFLKTFDIDMKEVANHRPSYVAFAEYDHRLHREKSLPALRRERIKNILRSIGIYTPIYKIYKKYFQARILGGG